MDKLFTWFLMMTRTILMMGFLFICGHVSGQITRPGNPMPLHFRGLKNIIVYDLEVTDQERKQLRDRQDRSLLKPARSGFLINTDFNLQNSGTWDTLADGTRVWRAAFRIHGARLMNLLLKPFHVSDGVRIFMYNPSQQTVLGAFSDLNNKATGVLATGHIPGDMLIMEVHIPPFSGFPGSLTIDQVGCDFAEQSMEKSIMDEWYGLSGSCNVDIACMEQESYQQVKNAIVRIVFMGDERCTGTLLNNTRQDGRNYVLTAEHCINTEEAANNAVFYFSYESPTCSGSDGSGAKSVSGATMRATGNDLDFSLLELLEPIPLQYHPYYAGWDNTESPPSFAYTIHHPQGDVKKISIDNHPLTVANFGNTYKANTHWLVSRWESGTTEAGSSGGGIFDPYNRVRGSLTGGQASCSNSVNDYFQMISHAWKDHPDPVNQLAHWLDPLETKEVQLDGFDPNADFWESGDTLSNILPGEVLKSESDNLDWGEWSGHNSLYINQFAERYTQNQKEKILGVILHVAHNYVSLPSSHLVVKVWQDLGLPGKVMYEKDIQLADLSSNTANFIEFDSIVSVGDSFFVGYELFYSSPMDTFSTYMAGNRLNDPFNTAYVYDSQWQPLNLYTEGLVHSSFAIMPVVFDSIPHGKPPVEPDSDIVLYPNPAQTYCWIEFGKMTVLPVRILVYNLQGEIVSEDEYGPYQRSVRLETTDFSSGVYIVHVKRGEQILMAKLVIIR